MRTNAPSPLPAMAGVVLLAGVAPLLTHVLIDRASDGIFIAERLHEAVELAGTCIALGVASLLLLRERQERDRSHLLWMVAALVAMGLVDGTHAISEPGEPWSWLRHGATLVGGLLFGLIWLPVPESVRRHRRRMVGVVVAAAVTGSLLVRFGTEWLPAPWTTRADGHTVYTNAVTIVNLFGGIGFLSGSLFFLNRYRRRPEREQEDLVFAANALLFSVAAISFGYSKLWEADWWAWHAFRLMAFLVVVGTAYRTVRNLDRAARRSRRELEDLVYERTRALESQRSRFQAVFDSAGDATIVSDPAGSGSVLTANRAACRLFGYTAREFVGLDRASIMDMEDPNLARAVSDREEQGEGAAEVVYIRRDGTGFIGEFRSALFSDPEVGSLAVTTIRDVTDRRRDEECTRVLQDITSAFSAALTQEQVIRVIVDRGVPAVGAVAGILGVLTEDETALEILASAGTSREPGSRIPLEPVSAIADIVRSGRTFLFSSWSAYEAAYPASAASAAKHVAEYLGLGLKSAMGAPLRAGDRVFGALLFGFDVAVEFTATDSAFIGAIAAQTAIAFERARLYEETQRSAAELRESDRRKTEFMALLSHELRNPLAPIRNSLSVLDRAEPGSEHARHAIAVIERQTGQLTRLVDDLLDITRVTRNKISLQRQTLELNELVRRTVEDHRGLFEEMGLHLTAHAPAGPVWIDADWSRIAQVVGNLLQNAARFTPRGGSVRVSVSAESPSPGGAEPPGTAILSVRDTGIGMEPEMIARLFQPFMQADHSLDRKHGGLGLGLAVSKGLIELHGGEIRVTSEGTGRGTEAVVRLPLLAGPAVAAPRSERSRPAPRRRVLIIEDNRDAATSLRLLLQLEGHEVVAAHTGPEGLALAGVFRPEILLCDIGLPEMDGYEVARAFRADAALQDVVLVALTGYGLPEDARRASDAGFHAHLTKPPRFEQLRQVLATTAPWSPRPGSATSGPTPVSARPPAPSDHRTSPAS